jgi:hypothetical protein
MALINVRTLKLKVILDLRRPPLPLHLVVGTDALLAEDAVEPQADGWTRSGRAWADRLPSGGGVPRVTPSAPSALMATAPSAPSAPSALLLGGPSARLGPPESWSSIVGRVASLMVLPPGRRPRLCPRRVVPPPLIRGTQGLPAALPVVPVSTYRLYLWNTDHISRLQDRRSRTSIQEQDDQRSTIAVETV